jgi:hypothetical protein
MYELNINIERDADVLERVMNIVLNYDDMITIDKIDVSIGTFSMSHPERKGDVHYGISVFVDVNESTATAWEFKALGCIESRIMKLDGYIQLQSRMTP